MGVITATSTLWIKGRDGMREYQKRKVEELQISKWVCDVCKRDLLADELEAQEAVHFYNEGGFNSVFGDGAVINLDLCQHCFKHLLGEYIVVDDGT